MPRIWEQRRAQTHCIRGHPFDETNTRWYERPGGYRFRVCRACIKERNNFREKLYGLGRDEYVKMLKAQEGCCALCGQTSGKRALAVDHDHATGRIRGLLCSPCNTGIGGLRDDTELLRKAIAYLELHAVSPDTEDDADEWNGPPVLRTRERELLFNTGEMLVEHFESDISDASSGSSFEETLMATYLPRSATGRYDVAFMVGFLIATSRVLERLALDVASPTMTVADELALHTIFATAIAEAQHFGEIEMADRLAEHEELLLADMDFLLLFEDATAEPSPALATSAGLVNLRFEEWFRPFNSPQKLERAVLN